MNIRRSGGFALPTVLIASMIMIAVLLSAVSSTAVVRVSIREQYFNQLSRNAADAGLNYAKACLSKSGGVATWSDALPLKPGTDCTGAQISGYDCTTTPTDSRCVMTYQNNVLSSFSVGLPATSILGWSINDNQNIETISGGYLKTCGIIFSGKVYCWGSGAFGDIGDGSTNRNNLTPKAVSVIDKAKTVSAGSQHACAIRYDGNTYCWGSRTFGQLGDNSSTGSSNVPVLVDTTNLTGDKKFKSIAAGVFHNCGIGTDNKAYCWGRNDLGQLGNGNTGTNQPRPVAVDTTGGLSGKSIIAISAGESSTCAIATSGSSGTTTLVYCWGGNASGQLGNGNTGTASNTPVAAVGELSGKTVTQISVGYSHVCVIAASLSSDSMVYCWGNNDNGRLGISSTTLSNTPVVVTTSGALSGLSALSVSAGGRHTCAVASNYKAYCWGYNASGQLGDGTVTQETAAVAVKDTAASDKLYGKTIRSINTGYDHTCAIASDNNAYCWGVNNVSSGADTGMLGDNTSTDSSSPVSVYVTGLSGGQSVTVSSEGRTDLLKTSDSSVWQTYKTYSKYDYPNHAWKQVSTGLKHQCGVTNDGQAYCWGYNASGQLGDGTNVDKVSPVSVYVGTSSSPGALYGKTIVSIQVGESFTCALASDSSVYCWGDNSGKALGDGSASASSNVPVAVLKTAYSSKPVLALSVGRNHACVITSVRRVYCWGTNTSGQLGDNTVASNSTPVAVYNTAGPLNGLAILSLTSFELGSCVIGSDNNAYCWGSASYNQLGDNTTTTYSSVPVTVLASGALSGKEILYIAGGYRTNYVIASDALAYSWGDDATGALGDSDAFTSYNYPVAISTTNSGTKTYATISGGSPFACGLTTDSYMYCWGGNSYRQLAELTLLDKGVPVASSTSAITSGSYLMSVLSAPYSSSSCALVSDSQTYCWGAGMVSNGLFDYNYGTSGTKSNILIPINQSGARVF